MNIIVFSKNRALQLELFLRSFKNYVKNSETYLINVLYTSSNGFYAEGYDKLISMNHPNVKYINQSFFKSDLVSLFNEEERYSVFFVDDDVFKYPFDFYDNQMSIFEKDSDILCRSLRLHPYLTYCYPLERHIWPPAFDSNNVFYWKNMDGDYGYPMSLDGHIFRTKEISHYIIDMDYKNPNSLEGGMAQNPIDLPKMICYDKSVIVNNPCNMVQNNNNNIHGNIDTMQLNLTFLSGHIISLYDFNDIDNISCHQEIKLNFIKE